MKDLQIQQTDDVIYNNVTDDICNVTIFNKMIY